MTIISGAQGVSIAVRDVLRSPTLVEELTRIETESNLQQGTVSNYLSKENPSGLRPQTIEAHTIPELSFSALPSLMIDVDGAPSTKLSESFAPIDGDADHEEYGRTYVLRILAHVSNPSTSAAPADYQLVRANRDRLELAVWRTLMRSVRLSENAALDRNGYVVSFDQVRDTRSEGLLGGFTIRIPVQVEETVTTPLVGRAVTMDPDISLSSWTG
jgi:hypothetical protein